MMWCLDTERWTLTSCTGSGSIPNVLPHIQYMLIFIGQLQEPRLNYYGAQPELQILLSHSTTAWWIILLDNSGSKGRLLMKETNNKIKNKEHLHFDFWQVAFCSRHKWSSLCVKWRQNKYSKYLNNWSWCYYFLWFVCLFVFISPASKALLRCSVLDKQLHPSMKKKVPSTKIVSRSTFYNQSNRNKSA